MRIYLTVYKPASIRREGAAASKRKTIEPAEDLPRVRSVRAVKIALALVLIFGYFLLLSFDGLRAYFTSDDGMNLVKLHDCFTEPLWRLAVQAFAVCTPAYRPLGGLFYRTIYANFHFDPLPFRVACYCVLALNVVLAGWLLRCLSGLWEIAAVGTLLFSYHAMLIQLFYNTGTVYDLLCATFYLLTLLYYVYKRQAGLALAFWPVVGLVALYACALDSKEMAASMPCTLLAYELVYYGIPKEWAPSVWLRFRAIALLTILTAAFTAVKTFVPTPMSVNTLYRPQLSPHFLLRNLSWYYNLLLYQRDFLTPHTVLIVVALMFGMCWFLRSRTMLFGLLFALVTLLPVLIIPARDSLVLYLPLLGWAAWCAVPLVRARTALIRWLFRGHARPRVHTSTQAALLIGLIVLLYPIQQRKRNDLRFALRLEQSEMRDVLEQLKRQYPVLPHNVQIVFTEDPFPRGDWGLYFLVQLEYADPTILTYQKKDLPNYEALKQNFQYAFAFKNGQLYRVAK